MKKDIVLSARNLKKEFSHPIFFQLFSGISLDIEKGTSVAIMGKSGEGKSTLLHILGTLEKPTTGELEICGYTSHTLSASELRNQHIGFVFQSYNLLEEYTTLDNVLMPARIARKPIHKDSSSYVRAMELLDSVGLSSRADFFAKQLSGGEKQRAAIARALCNDPSLILADEPSGNLDHAHSQAIHTLLIQLTKRYQKTLIVVTHDKELAAMCDRIFILKDGNLYENPSKI